MKNKGFTLVELLAVIAILAILVIIALPNVLKMYNQSKKNIFLTEVKSALNESTNKYISENMKGNKLNNINSLDETKLNLNNPTRSQLIAPIITSVRAILFKAFIVKPPLFYLFCSKKTYLFLLFQKH